MISNAMRSCALWRKGSLQREFMVELLFFWLGNYGIHQA